MKCIINGVERNLPDFLIVGTGKAGTTSLHYYLSQHPRVVLPRIKETLFWHITTNANKAPLALNPKAITSLEEYASEFDDAGKDQVCGEVCPSYLYYHEQTIDNLKKYHPNWQDVKIIIVLREPVSKVISQYYFVKNTLKLPEGTLSEALAQESARLKANNVSPSQFYVDSTMYYGQVKAYLENFRHVKVFFYEDLQASTSAFMKELLSFLGLPIPSYKEEVEKVYNKSKKPRVPRNLFSSALMAIGKTLLPGVVKAKFKRAATDLFTKDEEVDVETKEYLKTLFKPEVARLEKLLEMEILKWK